MTTYTPISNSSVDAGSPIDESLVTALRDNPIAISEGSTGAPRVQAAAFASDASPITLIQTITLSSNSTADFTANIGGYNSYKIKFFIESASSNTEIRFRLGSGSFDTGASDYMRQHLNGFGSSVSAAGDGTASYIYLSKVDTNLGDTAQGDVDIFNADSSTKNTIIISDAFSITTASNSFKTNNTFAGGQRNAAQADDRFRIYLSAGNASGYAKLYGCRD